MFWVKLMPGSGRRGDPAPVDSRLVVPGQLHLDDGGFDQHLALRRSHHAVQVLLHQGVLPVGGQDGDGAGHRVDDDLVGQISRERRLLVVESLRHEVAGIGTGARDGFGLRNALLALGLRGFGARRPLVRGQGLDSGGGQHAP